MSEVTTTLFRGMRAKAKGKHKLPSPRSVLTNHCFRLNLQHRHITEILGGHIVVDKNVQLVAGSRVLDSGTGTGQSILPHRIEKERIQTSSTGAWLFDLSAQVPDTVELVGIDISVPMFPKEYPKNMKLYEAPATSLPAEWSNSFDFINQRLLLGALTGLQWRAALSEFYRVLKPGGAVQLVETGSYENMPGLSSMPATRKAYDAASAVMDARGLLGYRCTREIPAILKEVGFSDVDDKVYRMTLGKQWGDMGVTGSKVWLNALRAIGATLLEMGGLGFCSSLAELEELLDRTKEEWDENPGVFRELHVITAKKV